MPVKKKLVWNFSSQTKRETIRKNNEWTKQIAAAHFKQGVICSLQKDSNLSNINQKKQLYLHIYPKNLNSTGKYEKVFEFFPTIHLKLASSTIVANVLANI